jgi:putative flippase GtrA
LAENTTEYRLPTLLAWLLSLPLINRLGFARRPKEFIRFLKFATVGVSGMVVDLAILNLMNLIVLPSIVPNMTDARRLLVANTISFTVAVISNFTWNRLWTFPESRERPLGSQLGKYTLVNVIGLAINDLVLLLAFQVTQQIVPAPWSSNLAKVFAIGVVLFWNYFVNRAWTYKGIE